MIPGKRNKSYPKYPFRTVHSVLERWYVPEIALYDFNAEFLESRRLLGVGITRHRPRGKCPVRE